MQIGDVVKLRPNFWKVINDASQCSRMGTVVRVNRIGNIDILLTSDRILTGVMLGNVERVVNEQG